jgi:hypothetical protein
MGTTSMGGPFSSLGFSSSRRSGLQRVHQPMGVCSSPSLACQVNVAQRLVIDGM